MKILTATADTQGQRHSDFAWCIEGEVVTPLGVICLRDEADPDGGCGCGRSFAGLNSHKVTTTAKVRDLAEYTFEDLLEAVRSHREQTGWAGGDADADGRAAAEAACIAETAAEYEDGAVLEVRLGEISQRSEP